MQIRLYAGAADAAGSATASLDDGELSAGELLARLAGDNENLAGVLSHCSLLVDGAPVRDTSEIIRADARVDVLPPFAGG